MKKIDIDLTIVVNFVDTDKQRKYGFEQNVKGFSIVRKEGKVTILKSTDNIEYFTFYSFT